MGSAIYLLCHGCSAPPDEAGGGGHHAFLSGLQMPTTPVGWLIAAFCVWLVIWCIKLCFFSPGMPVGGYVHMDE